MLLKSFKRIFYYYLFSQVHNSRIPRIGSYIYYNMYSTKIIVFLHCSNSNYRNNIYRSDFKDIKKNPCKIHIKIYRLEFIIFPPYTEMRLLDEYLMDRDWNSRGRVLDTRVRVSMKNAIFFF